jgi:hypothetical protein
VFDHGSSLAEKYAQTDWLDFQSIVKHRPDSPTALVAVPTTHELLNRVEWEEEPSGSLRNGPENDSGV